MSNSPAVPPIINKTMSIILRSPFHGLVSKTMLLITFTGRKSGNQFTTPVRYSQTGSEVTVFSTGIWWQNLVTEPNVTLLIRGQAQQGLAKAIHEDKQAIAAGLTAHIKKVKGDAKFYGITLDNQGSPKPEDVEKVAQTLTMIRVQIS